MTVQLWGEMPRGDWKLLVASTDQTGKLHKNEAFIFIGFNISHLVRLEEFFLNIHGTKEKPIEYENLINMKSVIVSNLNLSPKPIKYFSNSCNIKINIRLFFILLLFFSFIFLSNL